MENITNIPQEIKDKATRLCAIKSNTKTFEQRIEELMLEASKKAKKYSKDTKWDQRTLTANTPVSNRTMAEINLENAMKNLPSSMR